MKILIALLLLSAPARAIELSLEENRAERGSVGFVDMQRLFTASPDAARAKESFEDLVRQAEEQVNAKKAETLKIRMELESVKVERETLARSTPASPPPAAPVPAPEPVKAPVEKPSAKTLALPGMAPLEPSVDAPLPASTSAAVVALSTPAVQSPVLVSTQAAPAVAQGPDASETLRRLMEFDGRIVGLQADLDRKEAELLKERQEADKGLIDVEGRKTDQVLARLYRAINEVAHKEGVSVVVDKTTILYGHHAVDLTDKVLAHLKGGSQP